MFDLAGFVAALVPSTFEALVWWGIGGGLARAFGKQLDFDLQNGEWFLAQPEWVKNVVRRTLDFLHHWWAGALVMLYGPTYFPQWEVQVYWFGAGVFVDDLPDLYKRIRDMKEIISSYMSE